MFLQTALLRSGSVNPSNKPSSCNSLQSSSSLSGWLSHGWLSFKTFLLGAEEVDLPKAMLPVTSITVLWRQWSPGYFWMWLMPSFSWQLFSTLTMQITDALVSSYFFFLFAPQTDDYSRFGDFPAYSIPCLLEQDCQQADPLIF